MTVPEKSAIDAVVVGGGFFGIYLSLLLKRRGVACVIIEREQDLMLRASYNNQARVHNGYHYPRSLMTAVRSRINFPRFLEDFPGCVVQDFDKYYAVGTVLGKVTAEQFELFMSRVGAPLKKAPPRIQALFNPDLIEGAWTAREIAFDAGKLREIMRERLAASNIPVLLNTEAVRILQNNSKDSLELETFGLGAHQHWETKHVFNCTYSGLNRLRSKSGLSLIPLKQEFAEMALVQPPAAIKGISVTVMCGPFFSLMPFPDKNLWTLSHVRYTPHHSWQDTGSDPDPYDHLKKREKISNGPLMIRDAARFMPAMAGCVQQGSLWEIKTILPQSELDDGRPILFHRDAQVPSLISIMGSKLDNIYDLESELDELGI
jgi:glycine/D-amino acid oxidase-like deaminating enzyme